MYASMTALNIASTDTTVGQTTEIHWVAMASKKQCREKSITCSLLPYGYLQSLIDSEVDSPIGKQSKQSWCEASIESLHPLVLKYLPKASCKLHSISLV